MTSTYKKCPTCIIIDDVSTRQSRADDDVAESKITENKYLQICAKSKKLYENLLKLCKCVKPAPEPEPEPEPEPGYYVVEPDIRGDLIEDRDYSFDKNCDRLFGDFLYENREMIVAEKQPYEFDGDFSHHRLFIDRGGGIGYELKNVYWRCPRRGRRLVLGYIYTNGSPDQDGWHDDAGLPEYWVAE